VYFLSKYKIPFERICLGQVCSSGLAISNIIFMSEHQGAIFSVVKRLFFRLVRFIEKG